MRAQRSRNPLVHLRWTHTLKFFATGGRRAEGLQAQPTGGAKAAGGLVRAGSYSLQADCGQGGAVGGGAVARMDSPRATLSAVVG